MSGIAKPIERSQLRLMLGRAYFGMLRKMIWIKMNKRFANNFQQELLPFQYFKHQTILLRKLNQVNMWMQHNKIINLKIASIMLDGILIHPGEIFSYWKLIGKPDKKKDYVDGMVLINGDFHAGIGGGLCQLSNLIFWMTIHTPLTVIERHRHGYDVFPDSNRTQPFGSGATCFYPYGDLMIQNNTTDTYQLRVSVGSEFLTGAWFVSSEPEFTFRVIEKNHSIIGEYWGGYSRHNELYQQKFDLKGNMIDETLIARNSAIMMYAPFLDEHSS